MFIEKIMNLQDNNITCFDNKKELSYSQIYLWACEIKNLLQNVANKGDRIVIFMDNSLEVIVSIFSIILSNMVLVPLSIKSPKRIIEEKLNMVNSTVVICDDESEKIISDINLNLNVININTKTFCKLGSNINNNCMDNFNNEFLILFTSGTTGKIKAVVHTETAIINNIEAVLDYMKLTPKDMCFISKEYYHCSTFISEILLCIFDGVALFISSVKIPFNKNLNLASQLNCSIMFLNPTILKFTCFSKNKNVNYYNFKLIITSGEVLNHTLYEEIGMTFPNANLLNVYGLTEAGPRVCAQRLDKASTPGSVGYPINGVEVRLIDDYFVNEYKAGELLVKSNSLMKCYLGNSEETLSKYKDGWLKTGDIAYINENNEVFILGRIDDMIIRGSRNINPTHIENALLNHPDINDVLVFGYKDKMFGEKIICIYEGKTQINRKIIYEFCKDYIEDYEFPQEFIRIKKIPKTTNGKKSRKKAREIYESKNKCGYSC